MDRLGSLGLLGLLLPELESLSTDSLIKVAHKFGIQHNGTRKHLVDSIYKRYCRVEKYINYTYIRQLGARGKDGRTFLALDKNKKEVAIKIFDDNKSSSAIEREAQLQSVAAEAGISPKVFDYSGVGKYIVMEKLDVNLYDCFKEQNGQISVGQQKALVKLFKKLDACKIYHRDPNPPNFMKKGGRWYVIDFGFAKPINANTITKYGETPNIKYMPQGFKRKIQDIYADSKLEYIDRFCEPLVKDKKDVRDAKDVKNKK